MILRTLLPLCCAALLAPQVHADKFYLGSEAAAERMTTGEPAFVEGVLLREEAGRYVIRVEGGEIQLPKSRVWKVEKTDLTVAMLENREAEAQSELARDDQQRRAQLTAAAEARRAQIREFREAAAAREAAVREAGFAPIPAIPVPAAGRYDPVIDVFRGPTFEFILADELQGELGGLIRNALRDDIQRLRRQLSRLPR